MKFKKTKVDSLMGGVEWQFTETSTVDDEFKICASIEGVFFKGRSPKINSLEGLDSLAKTVSSAWEEHHKMQPKLNRTLHGH